MKRFFVDVPIVYRIFRTVVVEAPSMEVVENAVEDIRATLQESLDASSQKDEIRRQQSETPIIREEDRPYKYHIHGTGQVYVTTDGVVSSDASLDWLQSLRDQFAVEGDQAERALAKATHAEYHAARRKLEEIDTNIAHIDRDIDIERRRKK